MPRFRLKPLWLVSVPLLAGCDGPISALAPAGPAARDIAWLWWGMLAGATLIMLLVLVMVALALSRGPRVTSGRVWTIHWGLGFTMSVLAVLLGFGLWIGERIISRDDGAIQVTALAYNWGWRFTQPGPDGQEITTESVLYVPAGQPFDVLLQSQDVIHSFWVPQLGGKMDAIPGHNNIHRLQADAPGRYGGLCAEFCGIGHTEMRFEVVVYDPNGPLPDFTNTLSDNEAAR